MNKPGLSTVDAFKHMKGGGTVTLEESQLKELQRTLNGILADIVSVCDESRIRYTLGGGSCLGAVRHGGFIPWDDDIDINMPRRDFERFIPLFRKKFGYKYWIHTPQDTKGYNLLLSRIRLRGTSVVTREDFNNSQAGAFVDLFVIENTFDNPVLRAVHGAGCYAFGFAVSCRKFWRDRKGYLKLARDSHDRRLLKITIIKVITGFFLSFLSLDTWRIAGDNWNRLCRNSHSKMVTVPTGRKFFFGEMYNRSDICRTRRVSYDGHRYRVPAATDRYLKNLYGDYMKIPDPDDIEKHVFFSPFKLKGTADD
jgi:lipopolysaccharide cholinephosphotransferase